MKCPKCSYLGFETGDRCRNCGYDFSLLSPVDAESDYEIHPAAEDDVPVHVLDDLDRHDLDRHDLDRADPWIGEDREDPLGGKAGIEPTSRDAIDDSLTLSLTPEQPLHDDDLDTSFDTNVESVFDDAELSPRPAASFSQPIASPVVPFASPAASASIGPALPLFTPAEHEDDEPLIKLPATPRAPLAVRRTPDTPRLRAVPRPTSRPSPAPVLQFSEEVAERAAPVAESTPVTAIPRGSLSGQPSPASARLLAAAIDYTILLGIDAAIVYFTLRMAGLAPGEWKLVPVAPLLTFLALLKIAYFYAFTAVGGQTIGKMAVGTCVIADDGAPVDAAGALRRTAAGVLSFLLLGLGFVPALFGDHRALHDRLAGTRVIRLRSV